MPVPGTTGVRVSENSFVIYYTNVALKLRIQKINLNIQRIVTD